MGSRSTVVAAVAWLAALGGLAGGCGAPGSPPPGALRMSLGGAADGGRWAQLSDGQDAELVPGAQGGFHVWMKFRVAGLAPGHYGVKRTAHRLGDGQLVLRAAGTVEVGGGDGEGAWELPMAMPMFMCPSPIGLSVIDQPISFEVALTDDGGAELTRAAVHLVPRCPAAERDFCLRICTG